MEAKEYLDKAGLTEINNQGLDDVGISRALEKAFLEFIDALGYADGRWKSICKTHIEEGAMAIRKAIAMGSKVQS